MIEVNEYVRTNKGVIGELISETLSYPEPSEWILKGNNNKIVIVECNDYPVKHSKQLIDLIEVGDIINGYKVINAINNKESYPSEKCVDIDSSKDSSECTLWEEDIKTILTKEQYMANCYKVGGEDEC